METQNRDAGIKWVECSHSWPGLCGGGVRALLQDRVVVSMPGPVVWKELVVMGKEAMAVAIGEKREEQVGVGEKRVAAMAVGIGEKCAEQVDVEAPTAELAIGEKWEVAVDEEGGSAPKRAKVADGSMTRASFVATVRPLELSLTVPGRIFRTGSCGWYVSKTVCPVVGGRRVQVVVQCTCTVKGSKQWVA